MKEFIKEKWSGLSTKWKIIIIVTLAFMAMSPFTSNRQPERKQVQQEQPQKEPAQIEQEKRQAWIDKQFSPWDGKHIILSKEIKKQLDDEESFKAKETKYWYTDDHLVIKETFTCNNAFGNPVKHTATAKQDIYSDAVEIIEIQ